jgi:Alpha/beta hydrolase domain
VFGTPIEGTGTPLDGINQVNNMPLFEVEDAALAALQNWVANGVQPPHAPPISTIPVFGGLYDLVNTDQYGIGLGGIRLPEAQVPVEDYSPINFSQTSSSNLSPSAIVSEVESALTALSTGSINNAAVRSAGLCLLSGYFTDLSQPTLLRLYPTLASYVSQYSAATDAEVAGGFLTPADANAAIANAKAGHGPLQLPPSTIP